MDFKTRLAQVMALFVLAGLGAFVFDSLRMHLWANAAVGTIIGILLIAWLARAFAPIAAPIEPPQRPFPVPHDPQLNLLLDQVPVPLLSLRPDGGLRALNRAARALFKTDDLIRNAPADLLSLINRHSRTQQEWLHFGDGIFALAINEIMSPEGTLQLISLSDVRAEVRIAEATSLRDTLQLLNHEITNSLTPVVSLAETARDCLEDDQSSTAQAARGALDLLCVRTGELQKFAEGYRAIASLPKPVLERVNLGELVLTTLDIFRHGQNARDLRMETSLPEDDIWLPLDRGLIAQALLNILSNAAEATTGNKGERRVRVVFENGIGGISLIISDNGAGVPIPYRSEIFATHFTTKPDGSGIGLSLARQIALSHGGDLELLESAGAPAEGAAFRFQFAAFSRIG